MRLMAQRALGVLMMALLAVGATTAVQADAEVERWLDRMLHAIETMSYRGTLVYMRDGHVDTLHIVHRKDQDGVRERIVSIDGPQREVLRDGDEVRVLLGDDQAMVLEGGIASRLLPGLPSNRLSQPILSYRMSFGGRERVAGLYARLIEVRPRDQFRYGHRFWLEENTGMLLRSALLDHEGNYLQHLAFVAIELDVSIEPDELEPELGLSESVEIRMSSRAEPGVDDDASAPQQASWVPRLLPDGFRLASVSRGVNSEAEPFEHLLFTDGLASFSVYIKDRQPEDDSDSERIDAIGPVHVFTGTVDEHRVTVVGEVPSSTVAFVAQQMQRRQPGSDGH